MSRVTSCWHSQSFPCWRVWDEGCWTPVRHSRKAAWWWCVWRADAGLLRWNEAGFSPVQSCIPSVRRSQVAGDLEGQLREPCMLLTVTWGPHSGHVQRAGRGLGKVQVCGEGLPHLWVLRGLTTTVLCSACLAPASMWTAPLPWGVSCWFTCLSLALTTSSWGRGDITKAPVASDVA